MAEIANSSRQQALPPDFAELLDLSARVGTNPALVQGPGGNTSVKHGDVMWIKASGTWLAHATTRDIMVPVALPPLRAGLERGDPACDACVDFVRADLNPSGLRPSIETSVHAVMPQRVVVHVHCVETIAWAAQANAEAGLAPLLRDLPWGFVPYIKPGLSLSQAMRRVIDRGARVVILGNHGLVVAADTVIDAETLLDDIVNRLKRPVRTAPPPQPDHLERLARGTGYLVPTEPELHAAGTDPQSVAAATRGSLYPDHVIFLGPAAVALQDGETIPEAVARANRPTLPLILVPGAGIVLHETATAATKALARCLSDVMARLGDAPLHYISTADEAALLNWDAEKYRQSMDRPAP